MSATPQPIPQVAAPVIASMAAPAVAPTPITISTAGPFPASPNPAPNPANPQFVDVILKPLPPVGSKLTFQLEVTDNLNQTATTTATVTIQGVPTVTITPNTQAVGKTPFTLQANATSPGGTIQQFTWTLTSVAPPVP